MGGSGAQAAELEGRVTSEEGQRRNRSPEAGDLAGWRRNEVWGSRVLQSRRRAFFSLLFFFTQFNTPSPIPPSASSDMAKVMSASYNLASRPPSSSGKSRQLSKGRAAICSFEISCTACSIFFHSPSICCAPSPDCSLSLATEHWTWLLTQSLSSFLHLRQLRG